MKDCFYIQNEELDELKHYVLERICIDSDNDPYVSKKEAEKFAECIKAEKILISDAGHFNEKSGYKEFKQLLQYIK